MNNLFGDTFYIPLNKRLCRFADETGDGDVSGILPKMKIFTFMNSSKMNDICNETIRVMNDWIVSHKLDFNKVIWVVEPHMQYNLICKDIGLITSPSTLICDVQGNIIDIIIGRPSQSWLDTYLLPLTEI